MSCIIPYGHYDCLTVVGRSTVWAVLRLASVHDSMHVSDDATEYSPCILCELVPGRLINTRIQPE